MSQRFSVAESGRSNGSVKEFRFDPVCFPLDVMYANAPYTVIQRAMHIHPTVTELIPTMLGELKPLE